MNGLKFFGFNVVVEPYFNTHRDFETMYSQAARCAREAPKLHVRNPVFLVSPHEEQILRIESRDPSNAIVLNEVRDD